MKLTVLGPWVFELSMTPEDCTEHGFDFELLKELYIYKENEELYRYIPKEYFEPPVPPKEPTLFERLFKRKKKKELSEEQLKRKEEQEKMDALYRAKVEQLRAQGVKLYSKAELALLHKNYNDFLTFLTKYIHTESEKENPPFENRGFLSYRYSFTDKGELEIHAETATWTL